MNSIRWIVPLAGLLAVAAANVAAQEVPGQDARRPRPTAGTRFDTTTVETVRGIIVRVDTIAARRASMGGVHILLETGADTIPVHLAPTWYLDEQSLRLSVGDAIAVRASRITVSGRPALIAAEVTRGDATLVLRDRNGLPKWRRQPAGPAPARRIP